MKKACLFFALILCYVNLPFIASSYAEESPDGFMRLKTFLDVWDAHLDEHPDWGSFIYTDIFMTQDEWHYAIIQEAQNIYIDLMLDDYSDDPKILTGQIIVSRTLQDAALKIQSDIVSIVDEASTLSDCNGYDDIGFYYVPHYFAYYCQRFVMLRSEQIDVYGRNAHKYTYLHHTDNQNNHLYGYTLSDFVDHFLPHIDPSQLDRYIRHTTVEELAAKIGEFYSEEELIDNINYLESQSLNYIFPVSDTLSIKLNCDPETGMINNYTVTSSVMEGETLYRKYMQLFYEITDALFPVELLDLLALIHGEEFAWRDIESIRAYPNGSVCWPMFYSDDRWCVSVEDDKNGIPSINFYAYDERTKLINGLFW